ncbi:hypothetical protein [Providencia alcalifaciens]|uniref:hypothetical protein n=1 Tax=Providencia alcalifaciens TaxID=126385 RepID=UPI001CC6C6D9|nr:hypothetical protein [Providencia alcalifaciens]CAG9409839.1 hypothetical protein NVI2019_GHJFPKLH_00531 [Providencia alcalifaciens]
MKLYIQGDKSKAICQDCGLVTTTFDYRNLEIKESSKIVKNILVGVCDCCGRTVSTPAQSTPEIKKEKEKDVISIEAILPSIYIEILNLACLRIDPNTSQEMNKRLLFLYVHNNKNDKSIKDYIDNYDALLKIIPIMASMPKKRLSMKVSSKFANEFNELTQSLDKNKTETIKIIIASIKKDLIDNENSFMVDEFRKTHSLSVC